MKKALRVVGGILGVLALLIVGTLGNHLVQSAREEPLPAPLGTMVTVDGHRMSVAISGSGPRTLVLLSGGGTSSPILDFRTLAKELELDFRVVIVERFGYGFNDVVDGERSVDTVMEQSRAALAAAGVSGPYVLCPHSLSGLEALRWAQRHPDEVSAIVGLDMAVPETYQHLTVSMPQVWLGHAVGAIGMPRLFPGASESEAIRFGTLSDREKQVYRAVWAQRTATITMVREMEALPASVQTVRDGGVPSTPMLLFSSTGEQTGVIPATWRRLQEEFGSAAQARVVTLDSPHYVHDHAPGQIAGEIRGFLATLR